MDLRVLAIAAVALVGLWCLVVVPAMWLAGTMSQDEETDEGGQEGRLPALTNTNGGSDE